LGLTDHIELGNLDAKRDWGYAPDYVEAAWLMLQHHAPEDFVIATGQTRSIREFLDVAFSSVGIDDWQPYVRINPAYLRPAEVDVLRGDYSKAKKVLDWEPRTSFNDWVNRMIKNDIVINSTKEVI
jgi:GDPmannose 4,6-dehydratase